jgi:hypothetical protein
MKIAQKPGVQQQYKKVHLLSLEDQRLWQSINKGLLEPQKYEGL